MPGAVIAVPAAAFAQSHPVAKAAIPVSKEAVAKATPPKPEAGKPADKRSEKEKKDKEQKNRKQQRSWWSESIRAPA